MCNLPLGLGESKALDAASSVVLPCLSMSLRFSQGTSIHPVQSFHKGSVVKGEDLSSSPFTASQGTW